VGGGFVWWYPVPRFPEDMSFQGGIWLPANSRYAFAGLPRGHYRLNYENNSMPNTFDVELKETSTTLNLELPISRIEGQLVGIAPGKITGGMNQDKIFINRRGVPPINSGGTWANADARGRFTFVHLPPGIYTISGYDCQTSATIKTNDSVMRVELKPAAKTGEISGMVRGTILPANRLMFDDIDVMAFPKDGLGYDLNVRHENAVNVKTRKYGIRNLPLGVYGIFLKSYISRRVPCLWNPGVVVKDGLELKLDFDLPENRTISFDFGNADFTDRTAPELKRWRLRMPSGDWLDCAVFIGRKFDDPLALPLGTYTIEADFGNAGRVTRNFTVVKGEGIQKITVPPSSAPGHHPASSLQPD
jgi:hypothetical protein